MIDQTSLVGANGEVIDLYEIQQQMPKPNKLISKNGGLYVAKNPEYEEFKLLMTQLLQQQPQQQSEIIEEPIMDEPPMDETDQFIAELGLTDQDLMELQQMDEDMDELPPSVDTVQPQPVGDPVQQGEPVMDETNQDLIEQPDEEMVFDGDMGETAAI